MGDVRGTMSSQVYPVETIAAGNSGSRGLPTLPSVLLDGGQTTGHSIMKKFVMLGLAFLLIGCAAQPIKAALDPTVGQDIRVVVAKLGYPNDIREMSGGLMYVWGARSEFTFLMPADSTTTGNVACTIEIAVGADNRIKSYKFDSNHDGCDPYARALSSK